MKDSTTIAIICIVLCFAWIAQHSLLEYIESDINLCHSQDDTTKAQIPDTTTPRRTVILVGDDVLHELTMQIVYDSDDFVWEYSPGFAITLDDDSLVFDPDTSAISWSSTGHVLDPNTFIGQDTDYVVDAGYNNIAVGDQPTINFNGTGMIEPIAERP